ncbi:MAG TPA: branched-chain amino acid ABC transporter permease [Spirochaetales bacterium]|nr:branched-chain amino acid ABC transporter permease [Spirochaetales bacterium]HRY54056.1 branched-chain amino acid ABC transporter permease [Spirochaetia bacterium]HRZ65546.1 branched-chain amino acid ABC transporter permease [Spirochaetia bacterium]
MDAYIQGIIILTGINLLAVLGLSVLTGFTGLFSFGHAGFMAIGAYVGAIFSSKLGLPFAAAIVAAAAGAGAVSVLIGRLTLKLKGDYFCIATLGFGEAIRLILNNWKWAGGARGWDNLPASVTIWNVLIVDAIAVVLVWNLLNSRHGRNMVAVREEELAAQMAGVNVFRYKMIALFVSAALAGMAGAFMGHYMTYITPKLFNMVKSTDLTIIVIFGGLGSVSGSILGTLLLTALPEIFRAFSQWRLVFYGLAVIVIMVGRPQGLIGGMELTPAGIRKIAAERRAKSALAAAAKAAEQGGEE